MKYLIALLFAIGPQTLTFSAIAATEYDFEIIIFEDASGRYARSEQWQHELIEAGTITLTNDNVPQPLPAKASPDEAAAAIRKIKGIGLAPYVRKLKSNKRYNVLVHKAWRQVGLSQEEAFEIPIDSRPMDTAQDKIISHIEGSIKIVLARYLHIYTDMIYKKPRSEAAPVWYNQEARLYKQYPIKSHRRMRSKELHYLDHPMVGILVMAKPVDSG